MVEACGLVQNSLIAFAIKQKLSCDHLSCKPHYVFTKEEGRNRWEEGGTPGHSPAVWPWVCSWLLWASGAFFFFIHIFFFFLFPAVLGLHCCACFSLVAATKGCSLVAEHRLLIMGAALVVEHRLSGTGWTVAAHGLSCSTACGIFPDQGLNLCLLHWLVDSLPPGKPFGCFGRRSLF